MKQTTDQDYKALLSEVIKKQIVILGPDITLLKARNVVGLTVSDDGTVTEITGAPQTITQNLIDQFIQLSGLIVKKTMEPILSYHADETTQLIVSPIVIPTPVVSMPQTAASVILTTPAQTVTTPINSVQPTDGQFHPDQVDSATQKIIDDALKQQKV